VAEGAHLARALDAPRASEDAAGADAERGHRVSAGLAHRPRLAPGVDARDVLGAHHGALLRVAKRADRVVLEALHLKDEGVEVAAEGLVEKRWRGEVETDDLGTALVEVEGRPRDVDVARLPQAHVERAHRHVLGTRDETRGDGIRDVVDEPARLRRRIEEPHPVRRPVVEELARRVVLPRAEERVKAAAEVAMKAPRELGEIVTRPRHVRVMVVDVTAREVDRDLGLARCVGERVEPHLVHHRIPGREECFAQHRPTRERHRGSSNDDARRGHGACAASRRVPARWAEDQGSIRSAEWRNGGGPPAAATGSGWSGRASRVPASSSLVKRAVVVACVGDGGRG
jgi:hypothetical protein